MSGAPERDPDRLDQPDPVNPHSEDLDIEGPNESAPGHQPTQHEDEPAGTSPSEPDQ